MDEFIRTSSIGLQPSGITSGNGHFAALARLAIS